MRSFHFVLAVEHAPSHAQGLTLTSADGDLVVPDRLRANVSGTLSSVTLSSALVIVGRRSFLRDPFTRRWRPFEVGADLTALFDPDAGVLAVLRRATGLRKDGAERVGGTDCYRLRGRVRVDVLARFLGVPQSPRVVPATVWVGKRDFLLRRVRLDGPAAAGEPSDIARTVTISRFDESVTILAPAVSG